MSVLSDELSKPAYAGLSDQAAADAINQKAVAVSQNVAIATLKEYAIVQGIWPKLKAGLTSTNAQVQALCLSVVDWVEDPRMTTINVNKPEVQAMLSALVTAGILTQSQMADIMAMATKLVSWTSSVGLPEVGIGLVINARKKIAASEVLV